MRPLGILGKVTTLGALLLGSPATCNNGAETTSPVPAQTTQQIIEQPQTIDGILANLSQEYNLNGFNPKGVDYLAVFITAKSFKCVPCEAYFPHFKWLATESGLYDQDEVGFVTLTDNIQEEFIKRLFRDNNTRPGYPTSVIFKRKGGKLVQENFGVELGTPYFMHQSLQQLLNGKKPVHPIKSYKEFAVEYNCSELELLLDLVENDWQDLITDFDLKTGKTTVEWDISQENIEQLITALRFDIPSDIEDMYNITKTLAENRYHFGTLGMPARKSRFTNAWDTWLEERLRLLPNDMNPYQGLYFDEDGNKLSNGDLEKLANERMSFIQRTRGLYSKGIPSNFLEYWNEIERYWNAHFRGEIPVLGYTGVLHQKLKKVVGQWSDEAEIPVTFTRIGEETVRERLNKFPTSVAEDLLAYRADKERQAEGEIKAGLIRVPPQTPAAVVDRLLKQHPCSIVYVGDSQREIETAYKMAEENPEVQIIVLEPTGIENPGLGFGGVDSFLRMGVQNLGARDGGIYPVLIYRENELIKQGVGLSNPDLYGQNNGRISKAIWQTK
ncbi:MAG: hypothetical protein ABIB47_05190 [Candidatus Woesearchaeota archaeon]